MIKYDVIVIGSGAGMNVASDAFAKGLTVALVEHGPMGGTCLNRGCIPTKMLIYPADVIMDLYDAARVNVESVSTTVDFAALMKRVRDSVRGDSESQAHAVEQTKGFDWYKETGEFVSDYTLKVGNELITAPLIFIASGARPDHPPIEGLDATGYLTSDTILDLNERPQSIIIIGGGYIAVEYAHFFSAIGTAVTIIGRHPRLVKQEDDDVSMLLERELAKRMTVLTNHEVIMTKRTDEGVSVTARNIETKVEREVKAQLILVATGRVSNSDLLKPEKTGVKLDARGFIIVDEYLRTSKKGIWAFGDAIGKYMFRHVANEEAAIVWHNASQTLDDPAGKMFPMSYHAIPRAVFSRPQIATVGLTLREALATGAQLMVGQAAFEDTAKGLAMGSPPGFVRITVDAKTRRLMGATIIGPSASDLIQGISNLMYTPDQSFVPALRAIYIHPALSEVIQRAAGSLTLVGAHHHHHD